MSATSFREMSDTQLASLYGTADPATCKSLRAEMRRRDQSAADKAWWERVSAEWREFAHAQYLAAEAQCRGNLLSREGTAAGIDPWSLWSGSITRAHRLASEELRDFWAASPRMTVSQYAWHAARPPPRPALKGTLMKSSPPPAAPRETPPATSPGPGPANPSPGAHAAPGRAADATAHS